VEVIEALKVGLLEFYFALDGWDSRFLYWYEGITGGYYAGVKRGGNGKGAGLFYSVA
jgi:hypothetical protein